LSIYYGYYWFYSFLGEDYLSPLIPLSLQGRRVGIDNKGDITIYNNLSPLIPLSLQGEGEIEERGAKPLLNTP